MLFSGDVADVDFDVDVILVLPVDAASSEPPEVTIEGVVLEQPVKSKAAVHKVTSVFLISLLFNGLYVLQYS